MIKIESFNDFLWNFRARTKTEEILRDCGLVARTDGELFAQSINTLPGK